MDPDKREGQQLLLLRGQGHGTAGTVQGDWGESRLYSDILLMRLILLVQYVSDNIIVGIGKSVMLTDDFQYKKVLIGIGSY